SRSSGPPSASLSSSPSPSRTSRRRAIARSRATSRRSEDSPPTDRPDDLRPSITLDTRGAFFRSGRHQTPRRQDLASFFWFFGKPETPLIHQQQQEPITKSGALASGGGWIGKTAHPPAGESPLRCTPGTIAFPSSMLRSSSGSCELPNASSR